MLNVYIILCLNSVGVVVERKEMKCGDEYEVLRLLCNVEEEGFDVWLEDFDDMDIVESIEGYMKVKFVDYGYEIIRKGS